MTLPAHRFLEQRKKNDGPKVWTFDFDETITTAPKRLARLATAVRKLGDKVVVITGNQSPRDELIKRLTDDYEFPFDDLIQYEDLGTDGVQRAKVLEQVNAWCGVDNRADRAYTYAKVCPHLYLIAKPPGDDTDPASKKKAKKIVKEQTRSETRGAAPPPPNLRVSSSSESDQPEHECGTCVMWDQGLCWGYGNFPTDGEWVCDSWELDPDWQEQDFIQDALDGDE